MSKTIQDLNKDELLYLISTIREQTKNELKHRKVYFVYYLDFRESGRNRERAFESYSDAIKYINHTMFDQDEPPFIDEELEQRREDEFDTIYGRWMIYRMKVETEYDGNRNRKEYKM